MASICDLVLENIRQTVVLYSIQVHEEMTPSFCL